MIRQTCFSDEIFFTDERQQVSDFLRDDALPIVLFHMFFMAVSLLICTAMLIIQYSYNPIRSWSTADAQEIERSVIYKSGVDYIYKHPEEMGNC